MEKTKKRVMVYQDPLTEKRQEGTATFIKCLSKNTGIYEGRTLQRWQVQFDDGEVADRFILAQAEA